MKIISAKIDDRKFLFEEFDNKESRGFREVDIKDYEIKAIKALRNAGWSNSMIKHFLSLNISVTTISNYLNINTK